MFVFEIASIVQLGRVIVTNYISLLLIVEVVICCSPDKSCNCNCYVVLNAFVSPRNGVNVPIFVERMSRVATDH